MGSMRVEARHCYRMETSDCIMNGLFLGGVMAALNEKHLQDCHITHILSVDEKPLPDILTHKYTYKHLFALDLYDFDLLELIPECYDFIDNARETGGAVIVHCQAGMSRSATVVAAYLMQKLQVDKDQALEMVSTVRPLVRPNQGFLNQLQLFENMGCRIDRLHSEFRAYQLNKLAVKFKCGQFAEGVTDAEIPNEVFLQADYATKGNDAYFKCRKCRKFLFRQGAITSHNEGEGESAFDWRSKVPANKRHSSGESEAVTAMPCMRSLFVDPLEWMRGKIYSVTGKLHCPKCDMKLGSYVWYGEKCPCGAWVAPAFHIDAGKVDRIPSQAVVPRAHVTPIVGGGASAVAPNMTPPMARQAQAGPIFKDDRPLRPAPPLSATSSGSHRPTAVVAAIAPQVVAVSPARVAGPSSAVMGMDLDEGGGDVGRDYSNQDLETGINSINMDVDSG